MPPIITAPLSNDRTLCIQLAEGAGHRQAASGLVARRYAWRGYGRVGLQPARPGQRTTITAHEAGNPGSILGTLTVAIDGDGLAAEQSFGDEVAALRRQGRRLAEFTRLAVEPSPDSEQVLAALFHVGHALAHQLQGRDLLLIEVNPRHERYYARLLGARTVATAGRHATVDAPAVLMAIELQGVAEQIAQAHGPARRGRSLFARAFCAQQQARMLSALKALAAGWWAPGRGLVPSA